MTKDAWAPGEKYEDSEELLLLISSIETNPKYTI